MADLKFNLQNVCLLYLIYHINIFYIYFYKYVFYLICYKNRIFIYHITRSVVEKQGEEHISPSSGVSHACSYQSTLEKWVLERWNFSSFTIIFNVSVNHQHRHSETLLWPLCKGLRVDDTFKQRKAPWSACSNKGVGN